MIFLEETDDLKSTGKFAVKEEGKKPVLGFIAIAAVFLVIGILAGGFLVPQTGLATLPNTSGNNTAGNSSAVADTTIKYLNENFFSAQGVEAKLSSVKEEYGMYNVSFDGYKGTEKQGSMSIYASKDGKNALVTSQVLDLAKAVEKPQPAAPVEVQKSDKPSVELFVMSFCPYGVVAEKAMSPVVALLKDKADITVHFITSVTENPPSGEECLKGTDTPLQVCSLHGPTEAMEELRQVCIVKNYDNLTLWKYLDKFDANCTASLSDATALDACWKKAAQDSGIDAEKIDACSKSSEGLDLLKADEALATQYNVSGSPTIVVNGTVVQPDRTPEAFKQSICSAFNTAPSECSQQLSDTSANVSGSCGS